MTFPGGKQKPDEMSEKESVGDESKDSYVSLQSSLDEIKESLERLTRSVGELNSKLRSTGDVLKWVLDALSRRSEEKEVMYLKSIEASNELLSNFMAFVNTRVKPVTEEVSSTTKEKLLKKEVPAKESTLTSSKKGEEYLVKPSLVRKFQEEEGKDKDKKSR
jgi:predicted RNase H-like nuclease (RuvC/YqgF family)